MKMWMEQNETGKVELVGGKGMHLQKLVDWGAKVAPFFVLTTECFDYSIKRGTLSIEVKSRFSDFLKQHPTIVLRSSMIAEDQFDASFAGMFETILNVTESDWEISLKKIYESLSSQRVQEYMARKSL